MGLDLVLAEILPGDVHHFGGDALAFQILHGLDRGMLGHGQNPARRLAGGLAEKEFTHLMDAGVIFVNPIEAGDAAVEIAQLDVTADLLRANHPNLQLGVIHVRDVGAAAHGDGPPGLGHLLDGCFLQAAFGQAELEFLIAHQCSVSDASPAKNAQECLPDDAKARVEGLICHWRGGKAIFFFGYFIRVPNAALNLPLIRDDCKTSGWDKGMDFHGKKFPCLNLSDFCNRLPTSEIRKQSEAQGFVAGGSFGHWLSAFSLRIFLPVTRGFATASRISGLITPRRLRCGHFFLCGRTTR